MEDMQLSLPIEIVFVDDGSTDGSAEIASGYRNVRIVKTRRVGAQKARNIGAAIARGRYINFVDVDDYVLEHSLCRVQEIIESRDFPDILIAEHIDVAMDGTRYRNIFLNSRMKRDEIIRLWLSIQNPSGCCIFFDRCFWRAFGGWNENVTYQDDFELGLRAVLSTERIAITDHCHLAYCHHDGEGRMSRQISETALMKFFAAYLSLVQANSIAWHPEDRAAIVATLIGLASRLARLGHFRSSVTVSASASRLDPDRLDVIAGSYLPLRFGVIEFAKGRVSSLADWIRRWC